MIQDKANVSGVEVYFFYDGRQNLCVDLVWVKLRFIPDAYQSIHHKGKNLISTEHATINST